MDGIYRRISFKDICSPSSPNLPQVCVLIVLLTMLPIRPAILWNSDTKKNRVYDMYGPSKMYVDFVKYMWTFVKYMWTL